MKKNQKLFTYELICLVAVALFHAVTFLVPGEIGGIDRFAKDGFWIGYALIILSFLAQMLCGYLCLKQGKAEKLFLNLPMLRVGYVTLLISLIVGSVFLLIPVLPSWIGGIVSALLAFIFGMKVLKIKLTVDEVSRVGQNVKEKTALMLSLRAKCESLSATAKSEDAKAEVKKMYEAIRYSDPMSDERLHEVEAQIYYMFNAFADNIRYEDDTLAKANADAILELIKSRNSQCKLLK